MSHTLSELNTGRSHIVEKSNLSQVSECFSTTVHSAGSAADYQQGQQAMSLFTGAVIHGGQFNISINSLNQSPTLATPEAEIKSTIRYKRLRSQDPIDPLKSLTFHMHLHKCHLLHNLHAMQENLHGRNGRKLVNRFRVHLPRDADQNNTDASKPVARLFAGDPYITGTRSQKSRTKIHFSNGYALPTRN